MSGAPADNSNGSGRVWRELVCNGPPPFTFLDEEEHVSSAHVDGVFPHVEGHVEVVGDHSRIPVDVNDRIDFLPAMNARRIAKAFPSRNARSPAVPAVAIGGR